MSSRLAILLALCCLSAGAQQSATPVILGWGTYVAPHDGRHDGQDHGLQATTYCGANPESWVRGSAALRPENGWLSLTMELETDSPHAGPKGQLNVTLSKGCLHPVNGVCDAAHDPLVKLYTVETDEVSISGKGRDESGIIRRSASVDIPEDIARQVTHVTVQAVCTGSSTEWSGWTSLQDAQNAFEATGQPANVGRLQ